MTRLQQKAIQLARENEFVKPSHLAPFTMVKNGMEQAKLCLANMVQKGILELTPEGYKLKEKQ